MYIPNTAESVGESVIKWVCAEVLFVLISFIMNLLYSPVTKALD